MRKDNRIAAIGNKRNDVADDIIDGADRRSFSAEIDGKDPSQQFRHAVEAKEEKARLRPMRWRDA